MSKEKSISLNDLIYEMTVNSSDHPKLCELDKELIAQQSSFVYSVFEEVARLAKSGSTVRVKNFGSFYAEPIPEVVRNPKLNEMVKSKGGFALKFRPSVNVMKRR